MLAQPLGERERAREAEEPRGLIQCRERAGVPPRARRDEEQERERWDEHAPEGEQADLRRDEERDEKRGRREQTDDTESRPRPERHPRSHLQVCGEGAPCGHAQPSQPRMNSFVCRSRTARMRPSSKSSVRASAGSLRASAS